MILAGAVLVHVLGSTADATFMGSNLSFQFTFFIFFTLVLQVWRGAGPLSLDHFLRIDSEKEPDLFHDPA